MKKPPLNIIIAGQVDHGKSTLIGRLLFETGSLSESKIAELMKASEKRGIEIEWAFALDSLQLERTQGITLDTTQIWLKRPDRDMVLIDAPGHHELLRNMLTGATQADAALVLVDAKEGITEQTRKHLTLLKHLGITQLCLAINKMDSCAYAQNVFENIAAECVSKHHIPLSHCIPISAKYGENITRKSEHMPWYPNHSLLECIDQFTSIEVDENAPLRLPIQDVIKQGEKRIILGSITSGSLQVGDAVYFSPSGSVSTIKSFSIWPEIQPLKTSAIAGEAVGVELSTPVFTERGDVMSHEKNLPLWLTTIPATIVWLCTTPLTTETLLLLRIGTQTLPAQLIAIEASNHALGYNGIGSVILRVRGYAIADIGVSNAELSRFILNDMSGLTLAAGFIDAARVVNQHPLKQEHKSTNITPYSQPINPAMRAAQNAHKSGIFWMTGLSGSGKSTLAIELQKLLFARGKQVVILDGDNMRAGLSRDLGFSAEDRHENIRRAAEVARLFADAGMIVITAFITPTHHDQQTARSAAAEYFHLIHINADITLCESRDAKGLYKKARAGDIKDFTGVSAPFEPPPHAELTLDTATSLTECIELLLNYIEQHTSTSPASSQ